MSSAISWYTWKRKFGALEVNETRSLKELALENTKLKHMMANFMLENSPSR